jgi:hypothetical protein
MKRTNSDSSSEEEDGASDEEHGFACPCEMMYAPICADGVEYPNPPCAKRCYGVTDYTVGRCGEESQEDDIPCSCTRIYGPVCANGVDYSNEDCAVNCHGVTSFTYGRCDGSSISINVPSRALECPCPRILSPVCSIESGEQFDNPCLAKCRGLTESEYVSCWDEEPVTQIPPSDRVTPCACTANYEPICANGQDYSSRECAVNCQGVTQYTNGPCDSSSEQADGSETVQRLNAMRARQAIIKQLTKKLMKKKNVAKKNA